MREDAALDFKQIIRMAMDEYMDELRTALDGLTPQERRFQPSPEAHHVDFTVWHMARVEDNWINRFGRGGEPLWTADGWAARMGIPEEDSGSGYDAQQVADLPVFDIDEMMAYYDAVRRSAYSFLDGLSEDDLDTGPDPERPEYTIGRMFSHVIVEESQHVGQVAYLRGLQRGLGG